MARLVTGAFRTRSSSMQAVEDLMRHGIPQEDISLQTTDSNIGREFFTDMATKAPEGGVWGAVIGGIIGAIITALMASGRMPDAGGFIAGLPMITAVFVGVGIGMLAGLIVGALIGATMPEYETRFGTLDDRRAGVLVGVYCHDQRVHEVKRLLEASGARMLRARNVANEPLRIHTGPREYVTPDSDIDQYPPRSAA